MVLSVSRSLSILGRIHSWQKAGDRAAVFLLRFVVAWLADKWLELFGPGERAARCNVGDTVGDGGSLLPILIFPLWAW